MAISTLNSTLKKLVGYESACTVARGWFMNMLMQLHGGWDKSVSGVGAVILAHFLRAVFLAHSLRSVLLAQYS